MSSENTQKEEMNKTLTNFMVNRKLKNEKFQEINKYFESKIHLKTKKKENMNNINKNENRSRIILLNKFYKVDSFREEFNLKNKEQFPDEKIIKCLKKNKKDKEKDFVDLLNMTK